MQNSAISLTFAQGFLEIPTICHLSTVSKSWKASSTNTKFGGDIDFTRLAHSPSQQAQIMTKFIQNGHINYKTLKSISVGRCFPTELISNILKNSPTPISLYAIAPSQLNQLLWNHKQHINLLQIDNYRQLRIYAKLSYIKSAFPSAPAGGIGRSNQMNFLTKPLITMFYTIPGLTPQDYEKLPKMLELAGSSFEQFLNVEDRWQSSKKSMRNRKYQNGCVNRFRVDWKFYRRGYFRAVFYANNFVTQVDVSTQELGE